MLTNKQEIIRQVNEVIARLKDRTNKRPFTADFAEVIIEDGISGEEDERIRELIRPAKEIKARQPYDPVREKLNRMKQMVGETYKNVLFTGGYRERLFYKQAVFMADFEDDYEGAAQFQMYFPNYQMMSYEQLRTYFTWRSRVRRGDICQTDLSYVFLYIYELINDIGVSDGEDGLNKLIHIWKAYKKYTNRLDKYMAVWIRDYYVLNKCRTTFDELLQREPLLQKYYTVSTDRYTMDYYSRISVYNIKKSIFYTPENEKMLNECFNHIIKKLNELLGKVDRKFNDLIFDRSSQFTWRPFANAIFYMRPGHHPRNTKLVELSEEMIFRYKNGRWTYCRSGIYHANGRDILEYVFRRMEQLLRRAEKFRYKLTASDKKIDKGLLDGLLPGIGSKGFLEAIDKAIKEYYVNSKRTVIRVDESNLERIREKALITQEKLIVPEDEFNENIIISRRNAPEQEGAREESFPSEDILPPELVAEVMVEATREPIISGADANRDVWRDFAGSLEPVELTALRNILEGASAKNMHEFAKAGGYMLEVLLDGINQKALDFTGDTILEFTDKIEVYDEYIETLRKAVECEK